MDTLKQSNMLQAMAAALCFIAMPVFVFIGLLLHAALAPDTALTSEFIGWMIVFVLSIFVPVHLVAQTIVFLLIRNKFSFRRPFTIILALCILAETAIAFPRPENPFSLVFSLTTIPFFLAAYVVASGRPDCKPNNSFKSTPLRGAT